MKMLSAGSQGVANLILDKVEVQTTLGGFELVFWLQGQTVTPNPDYWALVHSADVQVDSAQGRLAGLGLARPATPLRFATRPTPSTVSAQFRLSVTAHQLAAIETLRNCGDLTFKLVVSGEGGPRSDPDRIERIHEDFWLREKRSAWIDKLVAAKALDVTLLEIPMPFVDPPEAIERSRKRCGERSISSPRGAIQKASPAAAQRSTPWLCFKGARRDGPTRRSNAVA